jgi:hypothetical protein
VLLLHADTNPASKTQAVNESFNIFSLLNRGQIKLSNRNKKKWNINNSRKSSPSHHSSKKTKDPFTPHFARVQRYKWRKSPQSPKAKTSLQGITFRPQTEIPPRPQAPKKSRLHGGASTCILENPNWPSRW